MKTRRIFALLLTLAMVFALAVSASAAEDYTITIDKAEDDRVYEAYQIFKGNVATDDVTNIVWGNGVTEAGKGALQTQYNADDAKDIASQLTTTAEAQDFAEDLIEYLTNAKDFTYNTGTKKYTASGLEGGYYLIVESTNLGTDAEKSLSAYMMKVVKDIEVIPKDNQPTIEKKVSDINDSENGEYINLQDTADHDIGDTVPFHVHVKLGNGISHYDSYKLVITDTMSKGLDFNKDSLIVKLGNYVVPNTNDSNYTVGIVGADNKDEDTTITITFENLYALKGEDGVNPWKTADGKDIIPHDGGNLILEYTAELNEGAVIGAAGNPNEVYMQYSNNPNSDSMGKSETDRVVVFTYRLVVNKVDDKNQPLEGAAFTLYKNDFGGEWNKVKEIAVADGQTTFSFAGLDDGEYKLVETATPAGYNKIEDQGFNIVATHDNATLQLTDLNGERISGTIELTANPDAGELNTTIVNERGLTLPSTGGIGTTIFYVLGGVLVCGAVVLLITKKRMHYEA